MDNKTKNAAANESFDIASYEKAVIQRQYGFAYRQLLALLNEIENARVTLNGSGPTDGIDDQLVMTRAAASTLSLILDPGWDIDDEQYIQLAIRHDSMAKVFASTAYGSSEHAMVLISGMDYEAAQKVKRWYLCISLSSPVDMYQILLADSQLAFPKVVAMLGQSCVLSKEEEDNKTYLIENVATFLEEVTIVSDAMIPVVGKTWMECSYAVSDRRHLVKLHLNKVIKRTYQIEEVEKSARVSSGRKSLGIVIEVMRQGHAMYRCYRNILAALKKEFDVTIYAQESRVDDAVKALGHQFVAVDLANTPLEHVAEMIRGAQHDMLYYPSIGMEHWSVILCNYRLAPVQTMTYGHPASSCSEAIDAVFFDADVASDPDCLTEKIIKVGNGFNAFARNSTLEHFQKAEQQDDGIFHIAITSSFIKLNWLVLYVCSELVKRSEKPLHFHFFVAGSGRMSRCISQGISRWLSNYTVYEEMPYDHYLSHLSRCSMRLGTMPFGGTNTTVDCMTMGIPSVVFDGPEMFSHFEPVLLRRLQKEGESWIDDIVCREIASYIETALALIENDDQREEHARHLQSAFNAVPIISEEAEQAGAVYADAFQWLFDNLDSVIGSDQQVFQAER